MESSLRLLNVEITNILVHIFLFISYIQINWKWSFVSYFPCLSNAVISSNKLPSALCGQMLDVPKGWSFHHFLARHCTSLSIKYILDIQLNVPFLSALPLVLIIILHTALSKSVQHLPFPNTGNSYCILSFSFCDYFMGKNYGVAYSQTTSPPLPGIWLLLLTPPPACPCLCRSAIPRTRGNTPHALLSHMWEGASPCIAHFCSLRNIASNQPAAIIPPSPQLYLFLLHIWVQVVFLQFAFFQVGTCTVVFQPFFSLSWIASYLFPVCKGIHSLSQCSTDVCFTSCKKKNNSIYTKTLRTPK